MADQPKDTGQPPIGEPQYARALQPGMQPPPTMNAGHIVVSMSPVEISIMLGQTRMMPVQEEKRLSATQLVEWFATLTLSPVAAKQLRDGLNIALEGYAKQVGPIPSTVEPRIETAPPKK